MVDKNETYELEASAPVDCDSRHKVTISSFGHKNGTPGADIVLNARKVLNPGSWARGSTGLNKKVQAQVFADKKASRLVEQGVRLVEETFAVDHSRGCIHLAVGCQRGKHRSVAIAEEIAKVLRKNESYDVNIWHRDLS